VDLDASHNQLIRVPSGLFLLPELSNLHLSYNLLTHLPGDPLVASGTAESDSGVSCDLPHYCINVFLSFLPVFLPDARWRCEKLKKLDLSHNRLRSLPDTFDDLKRLSVLNLSHNYLKELPQSCSWGCLNLVQSCCGEMEILFLSHLTHPNCRFIWTGPTTSWWTFQSEPPTTGCILWNASTSLTTN